MQVPHYLSHPADKIQPFQQPGHHGRKQTKEEMPQSQLMQQKQFLHMPSTVYVLPL
jgi:hypothetical protein